jgi:hypothetical protein
MKAGFLTLTFGVSAVLATTAMAQTLSPADILGQVEQKTQVTDGYRDLLNDPDPSRSMAAMEVMLESGDTKLQRMALEYGLYSPNPQVRYIALASFFESQPVLRMQMDGSKVKDQDYFKSSVQDLAGTVDSAKVGFIALKVGDFDPERSCYQHQENNGCFVRISETEVSLNPWNNAWFTVQLDDQGQLVGEVGFVPPAPITIPVSN